MSTSGDLTFRRATPADKDAVLGIRPGAFEGYDYLPAYYDHFMADAGREGIVCELDGNVVGFLLINIVDGGRSYLAQGGRVSEAAEGRGVFRGLVDHCRARARHAGCTRELMTTNHVNKHIQTDSYKAEKTTIMKKGTLAYLFEESTHQKIRPQLSRGDDVMKRLQEADLYPLFQDPEVTSYLFPAGWVMLDWVLYSTREVNIPRMRGRNTQFVSDVVATPGSISGLLSAHTQFPVHGLGTIVIVDVFGSDVTALERHVRHHVTAAMEIDGTSAVCFVVEESMVAQITRLLKSLGMVPFRWLKDIDEDVVWALGFETII